jgi:hypothetical protein
MANPAPAGGLVAANPAPAGGGNAEDKARKEAEDKRQEAEDKARKRRARINPLLFVLAAFGLWYLFESFAHIVITCAPKFECSLAALQAPTPMDTRAVVVMSITLITALWVSGRIFFPSEE